ncbi:TPA: hypothetical protein JDD71_000905 [Salmonella enterica subsp. salamae]|nr:hypothetical protein [Salmonella enterica subsp. salamae]
MSQKNQRRSVAVAKTESKKPARKQAFLNLAPLTGIALAINWLIGKLNLKMGVVKTTRMTTFS